MDIQGIINHNQCGYVHNYNFACFAERNGGTKEI